jgi:hypothetical protein
MDDALLQELRDLAQGQPSSRAWSILCNKLEKVPEEALRETYIPALNADLEAASWPDALRVTPESWILRFRDGDSIPAMAIVRTLDMRGRLLNVEDAELFAESPELAYITRLNLAYNGLQDDGTCLLAQSEFLDKLEMLDLAGNSIELRGIRALCDATKLSNLRSIDLTGNWVDERAARLIAESPVFANLEHLILRGNPVRVEGARALSESPHLRESIKCMWRDQT